MNSAKVYHMTHLMQKHEDPLDLRSLPLVEPPRDGWPAVAAALQQYAERRTNRHRWLFGLAAAASVTLALGLALTSSRTGPGAAPPTMPLVQQDAATPDPALAAVTQPADDNTLDSLISLSQGLESRLRNLRIEVGSLPAETVVYQAELEDLIVQVDEQLSLQPDSLALWNQRVVLMLDLEKLYERGLRREYARMASL